MGGKKRVSLESLATKYKDNTMSKKEELKAKLDDAGIEYTSKATNAELEELLAGYEGAAAVVAVNSQDCLGHPICITQQVRRKGMVTRHSTNCPQYVC